MVSSVDGRATIDGRVGELTGPADQAVLLGAREHAGALVVGGRTVHAEGYDGLLDARAKARRQARGLPPEPELVVFTRDSPSLPELWRQLRERHPDQLIVCEGGPTLLGFVIEHRLLDQLVLCLSPKIVGDDAQQRLLSHSGALGVDLELLAATEVESYLFLRYRLH
jgi:riboflavin biosynthesis pyrimidine reductase